mgnify:CR=1 FL=1
MWASPNPAHTTSYSAGGDVFKTEPGKCRWYFGIKGYEPPTGGEPYVPAAPLTPTPTGEVPVPDEDSGPYADPVLDPGEDEGDGTCEGFSLTDPTSWAGAGICVLVKLITALIDLFGRLLGLVRSLIAAIGGVVEAILGLVASLLEGLLDLLMALFVPDPGSWDFGGLTDQAKNRPPFSVVDDVATGGSNLRNGYALASTDCGTISDWGDLDQDGEAGDSTIECDTIRNVGGMNVLYSLAQIALWLMTGLGCWKMLGSAVKQ